VIGKKSKALNAEESVKINIKGFGEKACPAPKSAVSPALPSQPNEAKPAFPSQPALPTAFITI